MIVMLARSVLCRLVPCGPLSVDSGACNCRCPLCFGADRYWDSLRVKNKRSDLVLVKLGTEGIMPEGEFASSNGTKRVRELLYLDGYHELFVLDSYCVFDNDYCSDHPVAVLHVFCFLTAVVCY